MKNVWIFVYLHFLYLGLKRKDFKFMVKLKLNNFVTFD